MIQLVPMLSATLIRHDGLELLATVQHQIVINDRIYQVPGLDSDNLRIIGNHTVCDNHGNRLGIYRTTKGDYHSFTLRYNGRRVTCVAR